MTTKLAIYNSCFIKLGAEPVSATTTENKRNNLLNAIYDNIKAKQIREHPWNFAIKRAKLVADPSIPIWKWGTGYSLPSDYLKIKEVQNGVEYRIEGSLLYINDAATSTTGDAVEAASTTTNINATAHEVEAGDFVTIDGERRTVDTVSTNSFTLVTALSSAPSAGEEITVERPPEVYVEYIADVAESFFTSDFAEALAWYLAAEICYSLVQNRELSNEMLQKAEQMKRLARSMDAQEGTPVEIMDNNFINVRV